MAGQTYDFEIDGVRFRQTTLSPLVAIGIAAKLGTILKHVPALIRTFNQMKIAAAEAQTRGEDVSFADVALQSDISVLGPVGEAIADIPDDNRDRIIENILRVTFWQPQAGAPGFMPTWDPAGKCPVDGVTTMMVTRILYETYQAQFVPFTGAPGSTTSAPAGAFPTIQ